MTRTEVFAPAKINLTLHVTGQLPNGYHLLDSLVMFADVGDLVRVAPAASMALRITGPMAGGVPDDGRNLCWKAAEAFGMPIAIELEKHLPAAAGIGGGSSDAAAVVRAMQQIFEQPVPFDPITLGADVPVCMVAHAAHMQGIGEDVRPLFMDPMHAVLVNPRVAVSTPVVFDGLAQKANAPMPPWPDGADFETAVRWLAQQRNDLEQPALAAQPVIGDVLRALAPARLARMSGSGATCFGLCDGADDAARLAASIGAAHPDWWVRACTLR